MGEFQDVVVNHHGESDAILVAGREPCITIASDEEDNVTGRSFQVIDPGELDGLELRSSWMMAVLLCSGDTTKPVADWIQATGRDPRRVIFYLHADTNPQASLEAWHEAGLPIHSTWTISDWKGFHKHFGAHWNVRVFDDFR